MEEILFWKDPRTLFCLSSDFCPVGAQSETLSEKVVGLQAVGLEA